MSFRKFMPKITSPDTSPLYSLMLCPSIVGTLITAFLKKFSNQSNENISVDWLNKNLKATIIPLPDGNKFYELPDLSNNNSVISKVEKTVQNLLIPKDNLDTHSGSLKGGDAVQIGSIAGFEVTSGDSTYYK